MGKIFDIFRKKEQLAPIRLSEIGVDMHSHLIPGIDDGSKSMNHSIAMLAKFESLGYRKVITTPHIYWDFYRNTPKNITKGLSDVKDAATQLGLKIEIEAAAEYYFDDYFLKLIKEEQVLSFGPKYVLVEFAFSDEPSNISGMIFALQSAGYTPIIAHFERYMYWWDSLDEAKAFRAKGVKIQLNLLSIIGHYGPEVQKQARRLIDQKMIDFAGSDCHRIEHLMLLEKNLAHPYFHKLLENPLLNSSL